MRNYLILLFSLQLLSGCGGGGTPGSSGVTGSTIPVGAVSGTSFDGLVINGTVSVYDFTTGRKGALLAQAATDGLGLYNVSLQVESRPVLLELTGGYYIEEAGPKANVSLATNHKLMAVANYTTGSSLKAAVTTYSYLAAGLAQYEISKGTAVATAIDNANQRLSSLVGVNILTTTPKEIIDVANASATLTPELRYGFLAGAISFWTYNHAPSAVAAHQPPYTSIDFAQLAYQDIAADGLLDGFGIDSTGAKAQLSFGTIPLSPAVYRLDIGTAIVKMAGNTNNKTGLTGAQVLSFANSYIANTDPIFNNVAPTAFAASTAGIVTPATNQWARKTISIIPTASSPFGLSTVELLVDSVPVATSVGAAVPTTFNLDTTFFVDGLHTVSVRATDVGGVVTTANIQSKMDNTPPTSSFAVYPSNWILGSLVIGGLYLAGTASDNYSGVTASLLYAGAGGVPTTSLTSIAAGGAWTTPTLSTVINYTFRFTDLAGNCTTYLFDAATGITSVIGVCL